MAGKSPPPPSIHSNPFPSPPHPFLQDLRTTFLPPFRSAGYRLHRRHRNPFLQAIRDPSFALLRLHHRLLRLPNPRRRPNFPSPRHQSPQKSRHPLSPRSTRLCLPNLPPFRLPLLRITRLNRKPMFLHPSNPWRPPQAITHSKDSIPRDRLLHLRNPSKNRSPQQPPLRAPPPSPLPSKSPLSVAFAGP